MYIIQRAEDEHRRNFWSGRSQAVRLPKEFRFDTAKVQIRRQGHAVILEPVTKDWGWLDELAGTVDADFESAVAEQPPQQHRASLSYFE